MMSDPSRARIAIEEFERENPDTGGRTKLIDFQQWKRAHVVVNSYTVREGDVLMGIGDYYVERGKPRDETREESDAEFQAMTLQNYDREGQGPDLKLWFPMLRQRTCR